MGGAAAGEAAHSAALRWAVSKAPAARLMLQEHDTLHLGENLANTIGQQAGILMIASLLSFGKVTNLPGVPPSHSLIWGNAASQASNPAPLEACAG